MIKVFFMSFVECWKTWFPRTICPKISSRIGLIICCMFYWILILILNSKHKNSIPLHTSSKPCYASPSVEKKPQANKPSMPVKAWHLLIDEDIIKETVEYMNHKIPEIMVKYVQKIGLSASWWSWTKGIFCIVVSVECTNQTM